MCNNIYTEEIFIQAYEVLWQVQSWKHGDTDPANNFYKLIKRNIALTENQSKFVLKILYENQKTASDLGFEYGHLLTKSTWKQPFRIIDQSKKMWCETHPEGGLYIGIKMPYALKNECEKIISTSIGNGSIWDRERSIRLIDINSVNLMAINDFAERHGFEIDQSFVEILAQVEEIWQRQDEIIPHSVEADGRIILKNSLPETDQWWEENRSNDYFKDIFLAKQAGFRFFSQNLANCLVEKIASSEHSEFWIKTNKQFFDLYAKIGGPVAVLVTGNSTSNDFVKKFVDDAEQHNVNLSDIRVCYRLSKEEDQGFNTWVKDRELGGRVEGGKLLVFQNKPPKWLFSQKIPVKIILTNSCFPVPSAVTQAWMNSHSCVCYIGDIAVSKIKERTIVDL